MLPVFLTLFAAAGLAADGNWPQFRGPAGSGVSSRPAVVEWNAASGKNILWKTPIPGLGHSSPVIWGDRIFLTSSVPSKGQAPLKVGLYGDIESVHNEPAQSFRVFCIDRKSGKLLWERTAASGVPRTKRHPKSSHANPTPATDGKHLIAFFGSEGLYAYDLKGNLLWKKDLGTLDSGFFRVPSAQWGFASSPVIFRDKLIIQADVLKDSFVAAFDVHTGREIWRTPRKDVPGWATPAVVPYTAPGAVRWQVAVNGFKHIGGYDLATGKELWKLAATGGDIPIPMPLYQDGLLVLTSAHGQGRPIFAIRTDAAGDLNADRRAIAWMQERAGNYIQTPLLHGGLGYFCHDTGVLSVFTLARGERLYQQRLGTGSSGFSSSPVAAGSHLYITSEDGRTYVLALGREYKVVAENDLGETVMATAAVSGGVIYMRGTQHLFAIGERR